MTSSWSLCRIVYFIPFQMSINSSLNNPPLLHLNLSSTNSSTTSGIDCFTGKSFATFGLFLFTQCVLIMPVSLTVFLLGLKRWFQQWFESRPSTEKHSDAFIYHMAAVEFIAVPGCMIMLYGLFQSQLSHLSIGYSLWSFGWYGEIFFCVLTCTEYYLAVVHPITYRNLRKERGIRIRNITIGCVWLFNLGRVILILTDLNVFIMELELFTLSFLFISLGFTSLSILSVLTGSVAGEQGKKRRLNQSKKRAFCIVIVIQVVLLIRCVLGLVIAVRLHLMLHFDCFSLFNLLWLNLPSSLALPLFFLQRIGKSICHNKNTRKN